MITYTIHFVDAVTDQAGVVHFPAVSQLMAQAWAELCFKNNAWSSAELRIGADNVLWKACK